MLLSILTNPLFISLQTGVICLNLLINEVVFQSWLKEDGKGSNSILNGSKILGGLLFLSPFHSLTVESLLSILIIFLCILWKPVTVLKTVSKDPC